METLFSGELTGNFGRHSNNLILIDSIGPTFFNGVATPRLTILSTTLALFNGQRYEPLTTLDGSSQNFFALTNPNRYNMFGIDTTRRSFTISFVIGGPTFGDTIEYYDPLRFTIRAAPIPTPEPATFAMLGTGLAALVFARRGKRP